IKDVSKELKVKFLSFRDHLQPGEKDKWKLRIDSEAGEHDVELLATLFDASLEAIKPIDSYPWYYKGTSRMSFPSWQNDFSRYGRENTVYSLNRYFRDQVVLRNYEKLNDYSYTFYGSPNSNFNNFLKNTDEEYLKRRLLKANAILKEIGNPMKLYGLLKDPYGYGIPNVSIMLNYTKVKSSDAYGVYVIDAKVGDRITFTSADFITSAITVNSLGRYDVNMKETRTTLNEVAIRGYIKRTRETTTGASFVVMGKEVMDVPVGNVEQLLQGKVAGLNLQSYARTNAEFNVFEPGSPGALGRIIPRTNFSETAFFYPHLRPNSKGEFDIEFTIPQSLTRYKMLGFAHTKAFETLFFSKELVTQKQFAISANAPRFLRELDTIVLSANLNNLTDKLLKGNAFLELRNAVTGNVLNIFSKSTAVQAFEIDKNGSSVISWQLVIPIGIVAVTYKVVAESGKYSDGEENTLPVLSNSILVTEAISLNVRGNTTKTFKMDKLLASGKSSTMRNQSLTLEFTSNPIWNAIQALPYLMEYPYECAEQTMSRFYANSFATGILNSSPKIKQVFEEWQKSPEDSFASSLNRNASLKTLLLEETPWVRNADTEQSKMKRLAILFDLNRMSGELKANFDKLVNLQNSDGSFSWFKGMSQDRYITQHIVLVMSQLQYLKLVEEKAFPTFSTVLNKAIIYLDAQLIADFSNTQKLNAIYSTPLHYLYARSYSKQTNEQKAFSSALTKALETINLDWQKMTTYEQGLAALVMYRNGRKETAITIVNSLRERAQQSDEMGMYWPDNQGGWWWYQSPVETQALMVEVFEEVAKDAIAVEELKIWLLKNKQTNEWRTTKATTAACYALLMRGYNLLDESAEPEITLGGKTPVQLGLPIPTKEAGTGYRKIQIGAASVKADMGTVMIKNNNKGVAWGGLYWQYFEQADKVTSAASGIKIKKELFRQSSTVNGPLLSRLSPTNVLKKGDLIKVRMEIRCDRDMEYIHLKDMRAAGFEPVNVVSRYKYQDGLGYYESTKDASTNFFINYLRKGVYVFEYPLRVTHSGNFSNGITTLQSMYAPEFTTHSEGIRVNVK
ncbi:MAG: alpha-2-macroglobulin, partial [Pedobacter sp.]